MYLYFYRVSSNLYYLLSFALFFLFFFNETATTEIYTLSLHDALPISCPAPTSARSGGTESSGVPRYTRRTAAALSSSRSEEHTSELQSHSDLVCRLLLEKKKKKQLHHADLTRRSLHSRSKPTTHATSP